MSTPSSPTCLTTEATKGKLQKRHSDLIVEDPNVVDIEKTRILLYEYAGKGMVEMMDDAFFETTQSVINIGDDKVSAKGM